MNPTLSVRVKADNPDHHLWNNHGVWWCHYTVHPTDWTKQRIRASLGTRDRTEARARRDALFARIRANAEAAASGVHEVSQPRCA